MEDEQDTCAQEPSAQIEFIPDEPEPIESIGPVPVEIPQVILTSRSRNAEYQDCERLRYLGHEAFGTGYEPVRVAVPLATGGATHLGIAALLLGKSTDEAAGLATEEYKRVCSGRDLDLTELESQSYTFNEQLALVEGLVRLAGLRVVPKILGEYEVMEVERMDMRELTQLPSEDIPGMYDPESFVPIIWRSIPDALLRSRTDGDFYLLSWKTTGEYNSERAELAGRTDDQGISEAWTIEERLQRAWELAKQLRVSFGPGAGIMGTVPYEPKIRGVQMVHLVKGRKDEFDYNGGKVWGVRNPLIRGYVDTSSFPVSYATSIYWRCSAPHAMRKSKWYPNGECPGDGRRHKRPDSFESFPVWETLSVKDWVEMLANNQVSPDAGDALEPLYAMPVPFYRQQSHIDHWLAQKRHMELTIAENILQIRQWDKRVMDNPTDSITREAYLYELDRRFPQRRRTCTQHYGRKCPMFEICWGSPEVAQDPVGSGLYQIRPEMPDRAPQDEE